MFASADLCHENGFHSTKSSPLNCIGVDTSRGKEYYLKIYLVGEINDFLTSFNDGSCYFGLLGLRLVSE